MHTKNSKFIFYDGIPITSVWIYTQVLPICEYNIINKQIKTKDLSLDIVINVKIIKVYACL